MGSAQGVRSRRNIGWLWIAVFFLVAGLLHAQTYAQSGAFAADESAQLEARVGTQGSPLNVPAGQGAATAADTGAQAARDWIKTVLDLTALLVSAVSLYLVVSFRKNLSLAEQIANVRELLLDQYGDRGLSQVTAHPVADPRSARLSDEQRGEPRTLPETSLAMGEPVESVDDAETPRIQGLKTLKQARAQALQSIVVGNKIDEGGLTGFHERSLRSGSSEGSFVRDLSVSQNRMGAAVLSGALPVRLVLGLFASDIVEDWMLCGAYNRQHRGTNGISAVRDGETIHIARRHAEWLAIVCALHLLSSWPCDATDYRVYYMAQQLTPPVGRLGQLRKRERVLRLFEQKAGLSSELLDKELERLGIIRSSKKDILWESNDEPDRELRPCDGGTPILPGE